MLTGFSKLLTVLSFESIFYDFDLTFFSNLLSKPVHFLASVRKRQKLVATTVSNGLLKNLIHLAKKTMLSQVCSPLTLTPTLVRQMLGFVLRSASGPQVPITSLQDQRQ